MCALSCVLVFTQFVYAEATNIIKSIAFDSTTYRFFALYGDNRTQWGVKVSSDSGRTWSQVDLFEQSCRGLISGYPCVWPEKIIFKAPATLVAVGGSTESKYLQEWVVRWSTDGGNSWHMKKKLFKRFPVYAIDVSPSLHENVFNISGFVTGFSSYQVNTCPFDISTGKLLFPCEE